MRPFQPDDFSGVFGAADERFSLPGIPGFQWFQEGWVILPSKKVQTIVGSRVLVEMKGDAVLLEGTLSTVDDYMNLYLTDTVEVSGSEGRRMIGPVVLRGNNITLITPVDE